MASELLGTAFGTGALVGVAGWFITHRLALSREEKARRNNAARSHLEAQIEQLYGPLLGLIQHSRAVFEVAKQKLPTTKDGAIAHHQFSQGDGEVWHFFIETYFHPINGKIRELIESKMHLLDEGVLPSSFRAFFGHEVQLEVLHRLWTDKGVDSTSIKGEGWPKAFDEDVARALSKLRARHQQFLKDLGARTDDRSEPFGCPPNGGQSLGQ